MARQATPDRQPMAASPIVATYESHDPGFVNPLKIPLNMRML